VHGLPGFIVAASGKGDPNLQAVGILGHEFWAWAPGGQYSSPAGMGKPSSQLVGALGLLLGVDTAAAASMWEPSTWAVGVLEPAFQAWAPGEQYSNPAGMGEPSFWKALVLGPT
jgi:hypothetical protein